MGVLEGGSSRAIETHLGHIIGGIRDLLDMLKTAPGALVISGDPRRFQSQGYSCGCGMDYCCIRASRSSSVGRRKGVTKMRQSYSKLLRI